MELHSHQPMLNAGYSMALNARQLGQDIHGEFRILDVRHHANSAGDGHGLRYRNEARVIRRTTPVRCPMPKQTHRPLLFPARIESYYRHAELSPDGRYYLRPAFDQSGQPITGASPLIERLSPYASPATDDHPSAGWHFPLLDQSTVLVSCLNNDPNRMAILGFLPNQQQIGPVTCDNATQSRIVTPGRNELLFDDTHYARRIALFTFDGQNQCELCAQNQAEFARLISQYGSLRLAAGGKLLISAAEHLDERIGRNRGIKVKQNSTLTTEAGGIQHQSATDLTLHAQNSIRHNAQGDYSLKAANGDIYLRAGNGLKTTVHHGDMQVNVAGNALHQSTGPITLSADSGTITITDGTGGIQIGSGKIKLWGKQITVNGRQSITMNGHVAYEIGNGSNGNAPESIEALA
ncbi:MAG: hypothetical protein P8X74_20925, partial [Reinekea sp.]